MTPPPADEPRQLSEDTRHWRWRIEQLEAGLRDHRSRTEGDLRDLKQVVESGMRTVSHNVTKMETWQAGAIERETARLDVQQGIRKDMADLRSFLERELSEMRREMVTQDQFWPVKVIAIGLVGILLTTIVAAFARTVLR
jgi:hypothetical protein